MYRLRYVYDAEDLVCDIQDHLRTHYTVHGPCYTLRDWTIGALRALLQKELYLNVLPDPQVPYVPGDAFGLALAQPGMIRRLHYQIQHPPHLTQEWVRVSVTPENDLLVEYDFRPRDWSLLGNLEDTYPHAEDLPTARSGA